MLLDIIHLHTQITLRKRFPAHTKNSVQARHITTFSMVKKKKKDNSVGRTGIFLSQFEVHTSIGTTCEKFSICICEDILYSEW